MKKLKSFNKSNGTSYINNNSNNNNTNLIVGNKQREKIKL